MSSTVIPSVRYADARTAIEFLQGAFGFTAQMVVEGEDDTIEHAQLTHGTGMVMVGSDRDDEFGQFVAAERMSPVSLYVIVEDVAAHAERARVAGAEILMGPQEQAYGGSNYVARDLEGNVWSFGDYSPWDESV